MFIFNPYRYGMGVSTWDLSGNTIAQYPFNDNLASTTVVDIEGTNGVASTNTTNLSVTGKVNEAFDFTSSSSEYVDTNQTLQATFRDEFSVSLWVKPDDGQPGTGLLLCGTRDFTAVNRFQVVLEALGTININFVANGVGASFVTDSAVFADGATSWTNLSINVSSSAISLYVNGVSEAGTGGDTSGMTFSSYTSANNLYVGCQNNNGSAELYFDGLIDDFRIQDRVITPSEINGIYNNGNGTPYQKGGSAYDWYLSDHTISQYAMNDDLATTAVIDTGSSATNGTSSANTSTLSVVGKINDAFDFTAASSEYFDCNQTFQTTFRDEFSVSCWLKPDDGQPAGSQRPFGNSNGAGDRIYSILSTDGKMYLQYESNGAGSATWQSASPIFADGATSWTHLVFNISTSAITCYVNGSLITADGTNDGDMTAQTMGDFTIVQNFYVGVLNHAGSPLDYFDGLIDDFRIHDRVLTQTEISGIFNTGVGTEEQQGDEAFNPLTVANVPLWVAGNLITGLSDTDAVTTWFDMSTNTNDATQGTVAKQPTYQTNELNSLPVVRFDGSSDYLNMGNTLKLTTMTVFAVMKKDNNGYHPIISTGNRYSGGSESGVNLYADYSSADKAKFYSANGSGESSLSSTDSIGTTFKIITLKHTGDTSSFYVDGSASGSGTTENISNDANDSLIGHDTGGSQYLDGDIAEIIAYNSALSDTDRESVEIYLSDKYGISI